MADKVWKVGVFYKADDGTWYEIKKTRLVDRIDNDETFKEVLKAGDEVFTNRAFVLHSDGKVTRDDEFNCIDGIDGG